MITLRRLGVLLWAAALCPAPAPLHAHDEREPREPREIRSDDRDTHDSREDNSGPGSRDEDSREERDDRSGKEDSRESGRHGGRDGTHERRGEALRLERDLRGDERVRGEAIVVGSRSDIEKLRADGFSILESSTLSTLGSEIARLRVPEGQSVDGLLEELRQRLPESSVAVNTVFRASGDPGAAPGDPAVATAARLSATATIGIIDTGIEPVTPLLRDSLREKRGFAYGGYVPRAHGTAVGDIAAREGVALISADVFGVDEDAAPAATTVALAQSIDWLGGRGIRVINISIVGPDNPVLAHIVQRVIARGIAIVAAVGNEGPASPPVYPAAYPGVIAVTAVDERGGVYRRANRGRHVTFAARGVKVSVTRPDGGNAYESGTSFAAPLVAAALALHVAAHPGESAGSAASALAASARDLGKTGRDDVFGWGEIAAPRATASRR